VHRRPATAIALVHAGSQRSGLGSDRNRIEVAPETCVKLQEVLSFAVDVNKQIAAYADAAKVDRVSLRRRLESKPEIHLR
jgi:hypothetical protein